MYEPAFHIHREPYSRFFLKSLRSSGRSWLASRIPRKGFGSSWLLCAAGIVLPGYAQRTEGFGILASPHPFWISLIGGQVWFYSNSRTSSKSSSSSKFLNFLIVLYRLCNSRYVSSPNFLRYHSV